MPKRRASEDEDGSEYSAASAGSDNDTYVADKRTLKKQRKTATGGTAARRAPTAKASASAASSSTQALVHASTTHVLSDEDAEGAANALLDWFAGVYDARGMPWRKRFDPSWTAEQRGQRAYEVRDPPFSPPLKALILAAGLGVGNHAATDPSCDRHTLLQQVDG
jgi:A/G-specific adenine glycosylase